MSIMAESSVYESEDTGLSDNKLCLDVYEASGQFIYMPKIENDETVLDISEDEKNGILNDVVLRRAYQEAGQPYEPFDSSLSSTVLTDCKTDDDWEENNQYDEMETSFEENQMAGTCKDEDENIDDSETIATFLTAAGQRLALYAVEDSDEVFAVAVYDESGEPPTNFQFLIKSDVERLIGEGAVRTVKKPTQIKKQLLTNIFSHHTEEHFQEEAISSPEYKEEAVKTSSPVRRTEKRSDPLPDNRVNSSSHVAIEKTISPPFPIDDPGSFVEKEEENPTNEMVQRSTVDKLLMENEKSDDELTFADIEKTLVNLKKIDKDRSSEISNCQPETSVPRIPETTREREKLTVITINSSIKRNPSVKSQVTSSLICRRDGNVKRVKIPSGTSLLLPGNKETADPTPEIAPTKAKRPRKQQLTSVNRGDSEIIIQPFPSQEEETTKKKGRRKRKPTVYRRKNRLRRREPPPMVEVIEIDVEEKDKIIEITIDENKGSSDKENQVIMLGDSDDEQVKPVTSKSSLKCEHCLRTFRQKRALKTHSRVCPKSPINVRRLEERTSRRESSKDSPLPSKKKEFFCKICHEKFDVVVVLARHVRSMHSVRKKGNPAATREEQIDEEEEEEEEEKDEEEEEEIIEPVARTTGTERAGSANNAGWKEQKLRCSDCPKWFSTAALLDAHSLQHATKKSEKQTRRCQTCKKILKTRLLYIRHMRMHSRAKKLQKKLHHTRQATVKLATLRKRGRSRKL